MRKRILTLTLCACLGMAGVPSNIMASNGAASKEEASGGTEGMQAQAKLQLNREGGLTTVYYPAAESDNSGQTMIDVIKQRMLEALESGKDSFDISDFEIALGSDDYVTLNNALFEALNQNYRYFYVRGLSYSYYSSDRKIINVIFRYNSEYTNSDGSLNREKVQAKRTELENAVEEALGCVTPEMTDVEKVLAVHDYIVSVCDYDYENYLNNTIPDISYRMEGVLIEGLAVCQGYAETFCTLMQELGIDSYLVASDEMNHAWNLVSLEGAWYHVDCTWDDPVWPNGYISIFDGRGNNDYADEGYVGHTYFLKSDAEIKALEHDGWAENVPAASVDGAYQNYCFYNINQKMNYYGSDWYYLKAYNSNQVMKAKINEPAGTAVTLGNRAYYMHELNGAFYYAAIDRIYLYDPAAGTEELYCDITEEYPGYQINEFAVKRQQLIAVLYNSAASDYKRIVIEPANVRVTGVSLNKSSITLTSKGATEQLTATAAPSNADNKEVTWNSSDPSVATVNETGLVTAAANGTSTITVTTKDGNKTASCLVTVSIPIEVTGVTLDKSSITLTSKGATEQLTAAVAPSNADNKEVTWSSSNPSVAAVSETGLVTAVANGTGTITVTTKDGNKTASCQVTVDIPAQPDPTPENPDPENPTPENPDPENPTPENPDPENPDPENPDPEKPLPPSGRIAGTSRYSTALTCAERMRSSSPYTTADGKFSAAVVACADNFPDALAGSTLAASVHAPILLVGKNSSGTDETLEYINKNVEENGTIYLLGGTSAIPESVAETLVSYGFKEENIRTLAGSSRYETNMKIVDELAVPKGTDIVIVSGKTYADSLSISGIAGAKGMPIFLTAGTLSEEAVSRIKEIAPEHIYLIGGTAAVSEETYRQAESLCAFGSANVKRIAGTSRYATSLAVAEYFGMEKASAAVFAYGGDFPDGLTGGAFAAGLNAPVILVSDDNYKDQEAFLQNSSIEHTYIMGGTAAISDETMKHLTK